MAEAKEGKRDIIGGARTWFTEILGEGRKIIWPNRKELVKQTGTVIFTSLLFGVVILLLNGVFAQLYAWFVQFFVNV